MDKITLAGMSFYTHVGCTAEERKVGQHLDMDVELTMDLQQAGRSDDIKVSVDYAAVYTRLQEHIEGMECNLIETVAERAAAALGRFAPISATVRVRKHLPPIPGGRAAYAEVEITRRPERDDDE